MTAPDACIGGILLLAIVALALTGHVVLATIGFAILFSFMESRT